MAQSTILDPVLGGNLGTAEPAPLTIKMPAVPTLVEVRARVGGLPSSSFAPRRAPVEWRKTQACQMGPPDVLLRRIQLSWPHMNGS